MPVISLSKLTNAARGRCSVNAAKASEKFSFVTSILLLGLVLSWDATHGPRPKKNMTARERKPGAFASLRQHVYLKTNVVPS
jgi:hypothetical protein